MKSPKVSIKRLTGYIIGGSNIPAIIRPQPWTASRSPVLMQIHIDNRQSRYTVDQEKIRKKATTLLKALACPEAELSILIASEDEIARLNSLYLDRSGPTNVISFPMREGSFSEINPNLLGDVVICLETARKEAAAAGIDMELRANQLLVHGILHLFGYDHEQSATAAADMERMEKELLALL